MVLRNNATLKNARRVVARENNHFDRIIMGCREHTKIYRDNYYQKKNVTFEANTRWFVSDPTKEGESKWTDDWQSELWRELINTKKPFQIVSNPEEIMWRATENYNEKTKSFFNHYSIGGTPRELAWLIENYYQFTSETFLVNGKKRIITTAAPTADTYKLTQPIINLNYFKPKYDATVIDIIQKGFAVKVMGKEWQTKDNDTVKATMTSVAYRKPNGRQEKVYTQPSYEEKKEPSSLTPPNEDSDNSPKYSLAPVTAAKDNLPNPSPRSQDKIWNPEPIIDSSAEKSPLPKNQSDLASSERKKVLSEWVAKVKSWRPALTKSAPQKTPVLISPGAQIKPSSIIQNRNFVLDEKKSLLKKNISHQKHFNPKFFQKEIISVANTFEVLPEELISTKKFIFKNSQQNSPKKIPKKINLEGIINDYLRDLAVENKNDILEQMTALIDKQSMVISKKTLSMAVDASLTPVRKATGCFCFHKKYVTLLDFDKTEFLTVLTGKRPHYQY